MKIYLSKGDYIYNRGIYIYIKSDDINKRFYLVNYKNNREIIYFCQTVNCITMNTFKLYRTKLKTK